MWKIICVLEAQIYFLSEVQETVLDRKVILKYERTVFILL